MGITQSAQKYSGHVRVHCNHYEHYEHDMEEEAIVEVLDKFHVAIVTT